METQSYTNQSGEGLNLELSLCLVPSPPPPPLPAIPRPQQSKLASLRTRNQPVASHHPSTSSQNRSRKAKQRRHSVNRRRPRSKANNMPIKAPYPWSTKHRAVIHKLEYLRSNSILTITGQVKCKQCNRKYMMEYDLVKKFDEIASFIERNKDTLHDRAPNSWVTPVLPNCELCKKEKCVEPVIPEEEDDEEEDDEEEDDENYNKINWLFLLLGQLLGRLKLKQLKYFCAHTKNHRTGAKNRLIYLTYLSLCKQLQPSNELFHRS